MKNFIIFFEKKEIKNIFLFISLFSFIFLWGIELEGVQLRFLISLMVFHVLIKIYLDLAKNKFYVLIIAFCLFLILITHLYFNQTASDQRITRTQFLGSILFVYILLIVYYFYEDINKIKLNIISAFFFLFFISTLTGLYNGKKDNPYFCGGIKNLFFSLEDLAIKGGNFFYADSLNPDLSRFRELNLSYSEYIFNENSHLGMMAASLICYSLFVICKKKSSFFFKLSFFLFFILCMIKSSTTLLVGLAISIAIFLFAEHKRLNFKLVVSQALILLLVSLIFFSDKNCKSRLSSEHETPLNGSSYNDFLKKKLKINGGNLTSAIYFYSFKVASHSLIEKPFGWGLNNYNSAFLSVSKKFPPSSKAIIPFNNKDASNNFVKVLVEFGIFGFIFYLSFIFYIFNTKVDLDEKFFLVPFIVAQSLRGAGYFNGGFLLFTFLMIFSLIRTYKK